MDFEPGVEVDTSSHYQQGGAPPPVGGVDDHPIVTSEPDPPCIQLDKAYVKSVDGVIKAIEIFLGLITLICAGSYNHSSHNFFLFVGSLAFIISFILFVLHALSLSKGIQLRQSLSWAFIDFVVSAVIVVFYFLASCVFAGVHASENRSNFIVAAVFGFLLTILYGINTYVAYMEWRFPTRSPFGSTGAYDSNI